MSAALCGEDVGVRVQGVQDNEGLCYVEKATTLSLRDGVVQSTSQS